MTNENHSDSVFGYRVETDVVYGQGTILSDGSPTERDLLLDVYRPTDLDDSHPLPAVDVDSYLTPAGVDRVNFARQAMGLPALPWDQAIVVWNSAMAGAEDTKKAIDHVRANAATYNIDPSRIAAGGHSAGGSNTLNATFGLKADVAAIFPLSPPGMLFRKRDTMSGDDAPPTLVVIAQNDLPVILEPAPGLIRQLRDSDIDHEMAWVPGFPHFYPAGAVSLADDGSRLSVGDRIIRFLDLHLGDGGEPS